MKDSQLSARLAGVPQSGSIVTNGTDDFSHDVVGGTP